MSVWPFPPMSNRGHYLDIATFDIAGNSRSTHVKDLRKPIGENGDKLLKNAFNRDGLN